MINTAFKYILKLILMMETDLEAMLKKIPNLFKEREDGLTKREKALERLKASIDEEYPNIGQPDDVMYLDIGGTPINVLRRTLTQIEGSMLASRFSGRWDDSLEKTKEDRFFIDQPIELFMPLVNYLRELACETPLFSPPNAPIVPPEKLRAFDRMVEYYGMGPGVYPCGLYRLDGADGACSFVASHPDCEASSEKFTTFFLEPLENRHKKRIGSYEVKITEAAAAQVGWVYVGAKQNVWQKSQSGTQGAGYEAYSVAYDTQRTGMAVQGNFVATPKSMFQAGSVIRCENRGESWYIDGQRVASSISYDNVAQVSPNSNACGANVMPCLSIQGSFEIVAIELNYE